MSRKQPKNLTRKEREELLDELWSMVILLNTKEEVKNFFKDLLSETESVMLARRIRVARLLLEGKSYDEIQEVMKSGPGLIANVHRWLQGDNRGYITLVPRLEKELKKADNREKKREKLKDPFSLERLKKRYPLHFLLLNLLDLKDGETLKRSKF